MIARFSRSVGSEKSALRVKSPGITSAVFTTSAVWPCFTAASTFLVPVTTRSQPSTRSATPAAEEWRFDIETVAKSERGFDHGAEGGEGERAADRDPADARGGEVHPDGRTESARTDHQHARGFESSLTRHADLGHDQVTAVTQDLFVRQLRQSLSDVRLDHGASRYRRHDHDRVAVFHGRFRSGGVADVFVVEVDVDEVTQHVLIVKEMASQCGVC